MLSKAEPKLIGMPNERWNEQDIGVEQEMQYTKEKC